MDLETIVLISLTLAIISVGVFQPGMYFICRMLDSEIKNGTGKSLASPIQTSYIVFAISVMMIGISSATWYMFTGNKLFMIGAFVLTVFTIFLNVTGVGFGFAVYKRARQINTP